MKIEELDYELPGNLVAQYPSDRRDDSRLIVCGKGGGKTRHCRFRDIPAFLSEGDLLVFNDTKVVKARVNAHGPAGETFELFFLAPTDRLSPGGEGPMWECLFRPSRKVKEGMTISVSPRLSLKVQRSLGMGRWIVHLSTADTLYDELERLGKVPLPPYIKRAAGENGYPDEERYQTVYAKVPGSVAAPTAGLHFTRGLLDTMARKGIESAFVSLDVGYGTFSPIREEVVESHRMHREYYSIAQESSGKVEEQKRKGGRVIAVGTTAMRALESAFDDHGKFRRSEGYTDLFIYPGYSFKVANGLITNFHLPRSSLLALVMAFGGVDEVKKHYREAASYGYRFFSYGDAMMIL